MRLINTDVVKIKNTMLYEDLRGNLTIDTQLNPSDLHTNTIVSSTVKGLKVFEDNSNSLTFTPESKPIFSTDTALLVDTTYNDDVMQVNFILKNIVLNPDHNMSMIYIPKLYPHFFAPQFFSIEEDADGVGATISINDPHKKYKQITEDLNITVLSFDTSIKNNFFKYFLTVHPEESLDIPVVKTQAFYKYERIGDTHIRVYNMNGDPLSPDQLIPETVGVVVDGITIPITRKQTIIPGSPNASYDSTEIKYPKYIYTETPFMVFTNSGLLIKHPPSHIVFNSQNPSEKYIENLFTHTTSSSPAISTATYNSDPNFFMEFINKIMNNGISLSNLFDVDPTGANTIINRTGTTIYDPTALPTKSSFIKNTSISFSNMRREISEEIENKYKKITTIHTANVPLYLTKSTEIDRPTTTFTSRFDIKNGSLETPVTITTSNITVMLKKCQSVSTALKITVIEDFIDNILNSKIAHIEYIPSIPPSMESFDDGVSLLHTGDIDNPDRVVSKISVNIPGVPAFTDEIPVLNLNQLPNRTIVIK